MPRTWQLQEAKAKFSELVDRALKGEAQIVTRRGKAAVVVLDIETYRELVKEHQTAWEALREFAPRVENELVDELFERPKADPREVEL